MRMRHIVICGLLSSTVLFHIILKKHDFRKKSDQIKCILIFSTSFVWNISISKNSATYYHKCTCIGLYVQGCWEVLGPTRKETSYRDWRFWFSYILLIITIGGILVLFIYITSLASNEVFSPSNKIHWEVGRAKNLSAPLSSTHYSCQILVKPEISWRIFEKYSIKFHENLSSGSRVVPCWQTDIQTWRNYFANAPKNHHSMLKCNSVQPIYWN
jgi:hypothetical protein